MKWGIVPSGSSENPCCCGDVCNVIPRSLCGTADLRCTWYSEFTDTEADPPIVASCPPKFYRTQTTTYTRYLSQVRDGRTSTWVGSYTHTANVIIDEAGDCKYSGPGVNVYSGGYTFDDGWGGPPLVATISSAGLWWPNSWSAYINNFWCGYGTPARTGVFNVVSTTQKEWFWEVDFSSPTCVAHQEESTIITLSDEVTLADELEFKRCNEEACSEDDDPAPENPCRPCCTVRGATEPDSYTYITDEPEGCIIPGSSSVAWDSTACPGTGARSGQGVKLSLWFKDLLPGAVYKATIVYAIYEFAKDDDDEFIEPSGCLTGPVSELVFSDVTDEVEFTATDWAEMLSWDCATDCAVALKVCELEDEANDWNTANPEEPPRSVSCTTGGFNIPTYRNKYSYFKSCNLERIPTPPEP